MDQLLPKPRFGAPCNGCGMCCIAEPCLLARETLGATIGPCPALESEGDKRVCGLVKRPAWHIFKESAPEHDTAWLSSLFAQALGVGKGCDAEDETQ